MIYEWQEKLHNEIENLFERNLEKPIIINLYGLPWGKTYFSTRYTSHPSIATIHVENDASFEEETKDAKIVLAISIDILKDSRINYYFNVEEDSLVKNPLYRYSNDAVTE